MRNRLAKIAAVAFAVALTLFVVGVQGCGNVSEDSSTSSTEYNQNSDKNEPDAAQSATQTGEGSMSESDAAVTGSEIVVITTARGVIKFKFYAKEAPKHVEAFIKLARQGFYDGTTFHRVEPGFVVQGGDPYSKTGEGPVGTGGPGYNLKAEFNKLPHLEGTVAMARSQSPDSAGSQFYICLAPAPFLDGQYTVFGQVTEGMDVVKATQVGDVMESVRVETGK